MKIGKIIIGDRVLVQSGEFTKEIAVVKDIRDSGTVVVMLTNGVFKTFASAYIIKSFGRP